MNPDIFAWPIGYFLLAFALSTYQGIRGVFEQQWYNKLRSGDAKLEGTKALVILYAHDLWFRFVCSMAGFIALYACYSVATGKLDWQSLSTGTGAFLAASFIIGVIGVGGQLHYFLLFGKSKVTELPRG